MSGKKYAESAKKVNRDNKYTLEEAFSLAVETATAKFNESIDVAVNLGVDAKQSDQQVRGAVNLPHGLGKTVKILVFAKGEKEKEAKELQKQRFGVDGELFKKRQELVKPIQDKVYNAVKVVAEKGSYSIIFDKSSDMTML